MGSDNGVTCEKIKITLQGGVMTGKEQYQFEQALRHSIAKDIERFQSNLDRKSVV